MHVLVALDESDPAWQALDHAIETFEDADITALHVVDPVNLAYGDVEGGYFDQSVLDSAVEAGEALLERAAERAEAAGRGEAVETAIETGQPARTIVEYARTHDVDHLVVGSHGRSGVSRVLLGSVAETVVRRVEVPVTIVR
jgi:nucleotide-binding universal stress UspA family protein